LSELILAKLKGCMCALLLAKVVFVVASASNTKDYSVTPRKIFVFHFSSSLFVLLPHYLKIKAAPVKITRTKKRNSKTKNQSVASKLCFLLKVKHVKLH
jgi:hypothetical protein